MSFITEITPLIQKYAPSYGIKVVSPIIGQAVCESNMGKSRLAIEAHNYFGLKANKNWNGDIIIVSTNEEYQAGILTRIDAKFRKFTSSYCRFSPKASLYNETMFPRRARRTSSTSIANVHLFSIFKTSLYLKVLSLGLYIPRRWKLSQYIDYQLRSSTRQVESAIR